MTLSLDLLDAVLAVAGLISFGLGGIWGVTKLLLTQLQGRLDERFAAQDKARAEGAAALRATIETHAEQARGIGEQSRGIAAQLASLERDFLTHRAELPLQYVRREDYIRGQTVIEAKLDSLSSKLEVIQIKGVSK